MKPLPLLCASLAFTLSATAHSQSGPWPMERQDRWGTGMAPTSPALNTLIPAYLERYLDNYIVSNGPSLGLNNVGYFGDWVNNKLYSFDYKTGVKLRSFSPSPSNFIVSTPAIINPNLIVFHVNSGSGQTTATDPVTGIVQWTKTIGLNTGDDHQHASPIVGPAGDIVMPALSGDVYRWGADGTQVWHVSGYSAAYHTVAFSRDDTTLFVSNGNKMSALKYSDGSLLWTKTYTKEVGAPGVSPSGNVVFGTDEKIIYCVDPVDGHTVWSVNTAGEVRGAPGFDSSGNVFLGSLDFNLYSLRMSDGHINWTFATDFWCEEAPSVDANGFVYIENKSGKVYCVDPTGHQSWMINLGGEARGPLTIAPDGTVFAGFTGNNLSGLAVIRQQMPVMESLKPAKSTVYGGQSTTATVAFTYNLPSGGALVQLSSNNPSVVSVQSSVTIPAGQSSATFDVSTAAVATQTSALISATSNGVTKKTSITVRPAALSSVTVPSVITGGMDGSGKANFVGVLASDKSVQLSSSNTALLTLPPSVIATAGSSTVSFTFETYGVSTNTPVTVSATADGVTKSMSTTLRPAPLLSVNSFSSRMVGGGNGYGTVVLGGEAGSSTSVTLSSSDPHLVVPASINIPQHWNGNYFQFTTSQVTQRTTVIITATLGTTARTTKVVLDP